MTTIHTCSYRAFRAPMGQPVVSSVGLPRWRPEAADWPRCWLITPPWELVQVGGEDFAFGYRQRLERFGVCRIARALEAIAREHHAGRLVLLCHEADPAACHRTRFADWWLTTTGEACTEITP